ncbi:UNVERIFIED_CONTAM: hypothetical protein GTU68_023458 [Idotea baltica]|nr:hypothetical protein [Idotea baltica]
MTGPGFALAVLSVNILGRPLSWEFVVFAQKGRRKHFILAHFIMTGILGGFHKRFRLFLKRHFTLYLSVADRAAVLYVLASVILSIAGTIAALMIARGLFAEARFKIPENWPRLRRSHGWTAGSASNPHVPQGRIEKMCRKANRSDGGRVNPTPAWTGAQALAWSIWPASRGTR